MSCLSKYFELFRNDQAEETLRVMSSHMLCSYDDSLASSVFHKATRYLSCGQLDLSYLAISNTLYSCLPVSPIPETQPTKDEDISAMCQQLSHGLSLLNAQDFQNHDSQHEQVRNTNTSVNYNFD